MSNKNNMIVNHRISKPQMTLLNIFECLFSLHRIDNVYYLYT